MTQTVDQVLDQKAIEAQLLETHRTVKDWIGKSEAEIKDAKSASVETKNAIDKVAEKANELADRLASMEQKAATHYEASVVEKSIGEQVVESEDYKSWMQRKTGTTRVELKTAIVNATPSMVQPMVAGHRLDRVVKEPDRVLRVLDVLPRGRTSSNYIFFPKENTFTSAAATVVGGSPTVIAENVSKPEAALTFTSDNAEVVTIAHWIPVSKQVLADSAFLSSYVNTRMLYGLNLEIEDEIVNGSGTLGRMTGIYTGRTAYAQAQSPNEYTTRLDYIRDAKRQGQVANYAPTHVLLNPQDWSTIELAKDSQGRYLFSNPQGVATYNLWGMTVIPSNTVTAGTFLVFSPDGAQVWDREDASVTMSYEEGNNFTKNMVTILAEARLALTIYNAGAFIGGTLPAA